MIDIKLAKGTYVVAVSGGVDSMTLLHLLAASKSCASSSIIVAHFNHGIREDSDKDRQLVQASAKQYGFQFVYTFGNLGSTTSEDAARKARYEFLHSVRRASNADAIITAHHQDDRLETAFINLIRGTGRRGLTSMRSTNDILRPLLGVAKQDLVVYAKSNNVLWYEDSTNDDTNYLRNDIRKNIIPFLTAAQRSKLIYLLDKLETLNNEIDASLINIIHANSPRIGALNRNIFYTLDHSEASELMATWLRCNNVRTFSKKIIDNLVVGVKILNSGALPTGSSKQIQIKKLTLALEHLDR